MSQPASGNPNVIPRWLVIAGSVALCGHLLAVAALVLAAPSGPWMTPFGPSMAEPPKFAQVLNDVTAPNYLWFLRLTPNYHYQSNRPDSLGVYFEARLKDKAGKVTQTLKFPDPNASALVRQRQLALARGLTDDIEMPPLAGETIAPANEKARQIQIWDLSKPGDPILRLRAVQPHLVPRNRPVQRPSEWSLLLARAYARHLCREHGAASAEIVRHTKQPILAGAVYMPAGTNPDFFGPEIVASFGDLPRE